MSPDRLRQVLHYEPSTGAFTWRPRPLEEFPRKEDFSRWNKMYAGKTAGSRDRFGYVRIPSKLLGGSFYAHRLAWAYVTGAWPANTVDHIDCDPGNNRWNNLRDVSQHMNKQNTRKARVDNRLGLLGVVQRGPGKFVAYIGVGGRSKQVGRFSTPEAAHEAYVLAKRQHHPGGML